MLKDHIPYNPEMLAAVVRHPVALVEKAMMLFKQLQLVEVLDNGAIFMLDIQNFVGQSSTEGDRKRKYRKEIEAEKQLLGQMSDKRPPENRDKSIENREGESARTYGRYQNVFLSDGELADLQADFPTVWSQYIEKLSEYMASTGKRYQSHAATIRRWAGEDMKKAAPPTRNRDYSVKEDETV